MEYQSFIITQNVVIKNSSGEVLILRHMSGKWLLPGGKTNKGETIIEGLRRELGEEIALREFTPVKILDVSSWLDNGQGHCVITYLIEADLRHQIALSVEHNQYKWIKKQNLDRYEFWAPDIKKRILKAFE